MAGAEQPRRAEVDGREFILLTPQEHAKLDAARRQAGAANARSSRLRGELTASLAVVAAIAEQVEASPCTCQVRQPCLRCRLTDLLGRPRSG
ncbi:hypothetical protein Rhe02_16410 [Rhizocola hellebori]|uniref:Uncharacterized protein n=1 Tax=Rhizocola hellebori TaxID=1392758 RepID=A0A8J3Q530_9ACTN|nr:hypothetical protein [Rhizocola hellebori]GIH03574.1 hypothetical protein Rhe02_16410 [Rhizocola hellebori]